MARTRMELLEASNVTKAEAGDPSDSQGEALLLCGEHGGARLRFCRSVVGQETDAEDVVQETFLNLLQHLNAGADRRNLKSWLFTVAANACRDRLRGRVRWLPWRAELDQRTVGS